MTTRLTDITHDIKVGPSQLGSERSYTATTSDNGGKTQEPASHEGVIDKPKLGYVAVRHPEVRREY